jgi:flavin-dependent dehydrogenase
VTDVLIVGGGAAGSSLAIMLGRKGLAVEVFEKAEVAEKIRTEADYFERNAERMRYPKFRRQHLFVGSGVVEAGCNAECIVMQSLPLIWPAGKSF